MSPVDHSPLVGTWVFNPDASQLSTPPPRSWVQRITGDGPTFTVREEIVAADGTSGTVTVTAACDGCEHAVTGSPVADTIAYSWIDGSTLSGTGRKNGQTSLTETVAIGAGGATLTVTYAIFAATRIVANGIALFDRG